MVTKGHKFSTNEFGQTSQIIDFSVAVTANILKNIFINCFENDKSELNSINSSTSNCIQNSALA